MNEAKYPPPLVTPHSHRREGGNNVIRRELCNPAVQWSVIWYTMYVLYIPRYVIHVQPTAHAPDYGHAPLVC